MSQVSQKSFSAGELAPSLYARTDTAKYQAGLRTMRNMYALRSGGAANAPGTVHVGSYGTGVMRLLPFVFSDTQSYVLAFTAGSIAVIQNGVDLGVAVLTPYAAADLAALQITQQEDVLTIAHSGYPPAELSRLGSVTWTYTTIVFGPGIVAPSNVTFTATPNAPFIFPTRDWVVTSLAANGEESYQSTDIGAQITGTVSWDAVAGAVGYNVYCALGGAFGPTGFGFIGTTEATSFYDPGLIPDNGNQPPAVRTLFASAGNYPSAVGLYQQRLCFGGSLNEPQTVWMSRTGARHNFTVSTPVQDNDAVTFTLSSRKVNAVKHLVDAMTLLLFASGAEWQVQGDGAEIIRPTDINARQFSQHGSSALAPIQIDRRVLYTQARNSIIRDLKKDYYIGYIGADLTLFASHLFQGYTLSDWAYAETPDSLLYVVRSDGTLLVLTDVADQEMLAWAHWDTVDGTYENVCVVPEGTEDAVYVVVNRNGSRRVERFATRLVGDIVDAVYTQSTSIVDGRNLDPTFFITLSGSTSWEYDEAVTMTATQALFFPGDVDTIVLTGADGTVVRVAMTEYVSDTVMRGFPSRTVPPAMRYTALATWSYASAVVTGLSHLESQLVTVFGDGQVVANPNDPSIGLVCRVTAGAITLDAAYSVVHVGLPYVSDLQTLDIDTATGPSLKPYKMLVNQLTVQVYQSRGLWVGTQAPETNTDLGSLVEWKVRDDSDEYGVIQLRDESFTQSIAGVYNNNGRIFLRNIDPLPLTVLAVIPQGQLPPAA